MDELTASARVLAPSITYDPNGATYRPYRHLEQWVRRAVATAQFLVVVRSMVTLIVIGLLPAYLPFMTVDVSSGNHLNLPLSGAARDSVLLGAAALSALELFFAYRLRARMEYARAGVIAIESVIAIICGIALILGADLAILPLIISVIACSLLLLNQVRWAFRLRPDNRRLVGHRANAYAGYAPPPPDRPKEPQQVGYLKGHALPD